jgi:4-hydroxy-2-oxoglutarate aldolase
MLLEGLQLPLTTPFYADGRLNLLKLEHNVDRYSKTPVAGLVLLSAGGEPNSLADDETEQAMRCAIDAAAVEKVMIAGASRDSVRRTVQLAEVAGKLGYDAVLVRPPLVLSDTARGMRTKEVLAYFQSVADRSPIPVVLTGSGVLTEEIVVELAGHPQILGLIDGAGTRGRVEALKAGTANVKRDVTVTAVFAAVTGRMQGRGDGSEMISAASLTDGGGALAVVQEKPVVKTRSKRVGFQILIGRTAGMLDGLMAGAVGAMPAFGAAAPQACYEVYAAWKDGDEGLAMEKQIRVAKVAERVEGELGVAGVKFGCDLNGYYGGVPRLPILPLTGMERAEMESLMQGLRN